MLFSHWYTNICLNKYISRGKEKEECPIRCPSVCAMNSQTVIMLPTACVGHPAVHIHVTQPQTGWDWKGALEVTSSNLPAQEEPLISRQLLSISKGAAALCWERGQRLCSMGSEGCALHPKYYFIVVKNDVGLKGVGDEMAVTVKTCLPRNFSGYGELNYTEVSAFCPVLFLHLALNWNFWGAFWRVAVRHLL